MDVILDANVIVRYLVGDEKSHQKQAIVWFKEAEQEKLHIVVKTMVVAETLFVLDSFYKLDKNEVSSALRTFLSQQWFDVEDREGLILALDFYTQGIHFVDCFVMAMAGITHSELLSFDKDLLKRVKQKF